MLKFVQITATGHEANSFTQCEWTLFGLDADGHVWMRDNRHAVWQPLPMEPAQQEVSDD